MKASVAPLSCILTLVLLAPAPAAVSVRDDVGSAVSLPRPAARVIALAPNAVETLYAIGAGKTLVGACAEADYPAAARKLRRVGSFSNPDEEAILALRPDLVVMVHGNPKELIARLRARKVPVYVAHPRRTADVTAAMRRLGRLTGRAAGGDSAAAAFERRLREVASRVKRLARPRTAVMIWADPITLAGSGAYLHDAVGLAGGINVAADLTQPYPTLDPEQFAVRNPDAIVFAVHEAGQVRSALLRSGIRTTIAARSGRVVSVPEDLLLRAGPRLIEGIERMARGLHPHAFRK